MQDLVEGYNTTKHRSISMTPASVLSSDVARIKRKMYPAATNLRVKFAYQVGDYVRLAKQKRSFEKGYEQGWIEEMFRVFKQFPRVPLVYKVEDSQGEIISGTFNREELQKVNPKSVFRVEKILEKRQRRGTTEYLIKWLGYPDSANSWEPASNIEAI